MSHYLDAYVELTKIMLKARAAQCEAEEDWITDLLDTVWEKLTPEDILKANEFSKNLVW